MLLQHGTTAIVGRNALTEGLTPRLKRKGNWGHTVSSRADAVYLTNSYAIHFAGAAVKDDELGAIVEVNTHLLSPWKLAPDEDCLEQTQRGHDDLNPAWSMRQRTNWYKRRLQNYASDENMKLSLKALGNCCHLGSIPATAITRVAIINPNDFWGVSDPSISLMNYRFMGEHYRNLSQWIFDPSVNLGSSQPWADQFDRSKIEILEKI